MQPRFQKPLTSIERVWLGIDSTTPPCALQVVLEGHGSMDFDQLRTAVAKASAANPGSRLILKGNLDKSYWWDSGQTPPVRKVSGMSWDGRSPAQAPFLSDRLPHCGPTCEVLLVEGPHPRLIFRSNLAVMDARGIITWAEDVFRILRGDEPVGTYSNHSPASIAGKVTNKTRKIPPIESIAPTGKTQPIKPGATWKRLSFHGIFSSVVVGKVAWALAQSAWQYGDGVFRLAVPVDLRPRQPGLRSTGNLTTALFVDVTKDSTPDSIRQDIGEQLYNKCDCLLFEHEIATDRIPITFLGIGLNQMSKKHQKNGLYGISALVSNLESIDTRKLHGAGFYTDTTFIIPPRLDALPAFIAMTGSMNRLEITVSVPTTLGTDNRFENLLQSISQTCAPDKVPEVIIPITPPASSQFDAEISALALGDAIRTGDPPDGTTLTN